MSIRGAFPWIASTLLHAGLLLLPVGALLFPLSPRPRSPIDLTFADTRGGPVGTRSSGRSEIAPAGLEPIVGASPEAVTSGAPGGVPQTEGEGATKGSGPTPLPGVDEVLAELPFGMAGTRASEPGQAEAGVQGNAGPQIGWEGSPRTLLRKGDLPFPTQLSAGGQEVEGEARITVAPSGAVTRVEITRSTGYIDIDASVEAALRDYLFSRVDSRGDARGTVRFRFRLEKLD